MKSDFVTHISQTAWNLLLQLFQLRPHSIAHTSESDTSNNFFSADYKVKFSWTLQSVWGQRGDTTDRQRLSNRQRGGTTDRQKLSSRQKGGRQRLSSMVVLVGKGWAADRGGNTNRQRLSSRQRGGTGRQRLNSRQKGSTGRRGWAAGSTGRERLSSRQRGGTK